jgi:hypothetical protein
MGYDMNLGNINFENMVKRTAQMLSFEVSVEDIREALIAEGCTEEQAYFVYIAAKLLLREPANP